MKITTLMLTAVAALGFSALQASADTTALHSALNVSITVTTNKAPTFSSSTDHSATANANIGNKQLLDLFALWEGADRTTAPWKNAKLVIGWDWDGDVLVVDQTGTNVLFDATDTGSSDFNFGVEWVMDEDFGAGTVNYNNSANGSFNGNDTDAAYYWLYVVDGTIPYTDIWGYGGSTQTFSQTWNSSVYLNWSDTENAMFPFQGDQYFLDFGSLSSSKATITATGNGKGFNLTNWAYNTWYVDWPF